MTVVDRGGVSTGLPSRADRDPRLRGTKALVRYVEARDGHNWENWRDRLRDGLTWAYPGPMWMVYE